MQQLQPFAGSAHLLFTSSPISPVYSVLPLLFLQWLVKDRIMESQLDLGWKEPYSSSHSTPLDGQGCLPLAQAAPSLTWLINHAQSEDKSTQPGSPSPSLHGRNQKLPETRPVLPGKARGAGGELPLVMAEWLQCISPGCNIIGTALSCYPKLLRGCRAQWQHCGCHPGTGQQKELSPSPGAALTPALPGIPCLTLDRHGRFARPRRQSWDPQS